MRVVDVALSARAGERFPADEEQPGLSDRCRSEVVSRRVDRLSQVHGSAPRCGRCGRA
jgi:hypothetical protein